MNPSVFSAQLIAALRADKQTLPDADLHLLYIPELGDPLGLAGDTRRISATIPSVPGAPDDESDADTRPRLVTLDCRRVAAYLFETDTALDDPLFEAGITQAYAEYHLGQRADAGLENGDPSFTGVSIGGWLLSAEPAASIARRIAECAFFHPRTGRRERVRWHDPAYLGALWPALSPQQRAALLGDVRWFAFDGLARLRRYTADMSDSDGGATPLLRGWVPLSPGQPELIENVPLVRDLLAAWKDMAGSVPDDAEAVLHHHVASARKRGLDADSIAIYAMIVVQLEPGAAGDAEWIDLCRDTARRGDVLRDRLDELSDRFWARWLPIGPGVDKHERQETG